MLAAHSLGISAGQTPQRKDHLELPSCGYEGPPAACVRVCLSACDGFHTSDIMLWLAVEPGAEMVAVVQCVAMIWRVLLRV